ncbi:nicotinate phosphoribosyltransferase [Entamoeba nuttalli P19]|uniref:nicotinate phosphoribosyltransferase n=1 Tax=Entamoeba nuttalli (strain P19) TaxID=1076696 RepID=K2G4W2_ENTNP|nr:nicotinate phosphoribosyltransferase [Entamoeba nuttalli P19]EKE37361.1 nicotinate phosphoribosyltransferase [Entamoeba nuttalli P19]|eukprot:XP_008860291.1 nicotinate phosphoribosyltransferase [Entamoeba nuttalli P19]
MPIITSILDNDLYKFTVSNGYFCLYPYASGVFSFRDRNLMNFPDGFAEMLQKEINEMASISTTTEEVEYLKTLKYLPPTYIEFIKNFHYDPKEVKVEIINNKLHIDCTGYLYRMTLWEVPLLAIVSELYQKMTHHTADMDYVIKTTALKAKKLTEAGCKYSDFGTRRRFSKEVHDVVVKTLKENSGNNFIGSSNIYLAMKYNIKPIGTHPHEWMMFHAAAYGYKGANALGLTRWRDLYRGYLCCALTDTFTTDVFFREFDRPLAMSFDGIRHDSESPFVFADKAIAFYKKMGIDPMIKNIVFSDSLTYEKAIELQNYCKGKINCSFGIGTHFTCDTGNDNKPLNIVMKLLKAKEYDENEFVGCVKLSDAVGKHLGEEKDILTCKLSLGLN